MLRRRDRRDRGPGPLSGRRDAPRDRRPAASVQWPRWRICRRDRRDPAGPGRLPSRGPDTRSGPESDLWLLFALLKRDATDLVVQKATELGVSRLIPVITERTIADRINADRLVAIATEAAEQSERLTVPDLDPPARIGAVLDRWPAGRTLTVAAERRTASFPAARFGEPGALLVGPEGGFSRGEVEALERQPFVTWASLGPRILRAETAAIAGLALLQRPTAG